MRKFLLDRKFVAVLALWMCLISVPPSNALAMPSESISAVTAPSIREAQIAGVLAVLSRPEARAQMVMMGIDQKTLKEKLAALDDSQLASVAQKAESVKAGGDGLGLIIVLLVIVILVLVIMKLSDKRIEIKDAKK